MKERLEQLRKILRATGPGHSIENLKNLGLFEDGDFNALQTLITRGDVVRIGKYYWLKTHAPKRYPKPPAPPPAQPIKQALTRVGIQEENGRIVKRTPRGKP